MDSENHDKGRIYCTGGVKTTPGWKRREDREEKREDDGEEYR